jgi:hypothetical protein
MSAGRAGSKGRGWKEQPGKAHPWRLWVGTALVAGGRGGLPELDEGEEVGKGGRGVDSEEMEGR